MQFVLKGMLEFDLSIMEMEVNISVVAFVTHFDRSIFSQPNAKLEWDYKYRMPTYILLRIPT